MQLWDRGTWIPEGNKSPKAALADGELKFTLDGERLHGRWVLVRMKNDKSGGTSANWLLIKHHDDAARDGEGDAILAEGRSVASGRTMEAIAAGKGKGPKPFMVRGTAATAADAVWGSNKGVAAVKRAVRNSKTLKRAGLVSLTKKSQKTSAMLPSFIPPQLCESIERPPDGTGWVHEIKSDGYRVQLRVVDGKVTLKTRKSIDWTEKFGAITSAAAKLPDAIIDCEIVALDANGAPDFAALQAALSEGRTDELIFFVISCSTARVTSENVLCPSAGSVCGSFFRTMVTILLFVSSSISRLAARPFCARPAGSL